LALTTAKMREIISDNGHLIMEGDEPRDELIDAIFNLRDHLWTDCCLTRNVTPIEVLIPDFRVFNPRHSRKSNAVNVDVPADVL
jgi:hypothetical protein